MVFILKLFAARKCKTNKKKKTIYSALFEQQSLVFQCVGLRHQARGLVLSVELLGTVTLSNYVATLRFYGPSLFLLVFVFYHASQSRSL
jgi:hypothetical protein